MADIMPHAGVWFLNVKTDGFNTRNDRGFVFRTDNVTMNLWQFPIGVTFLKNFPSSTGWTIRPKTDISFIPTAGDKDATTRVSVPGMGTGDTLATDVMDSTSWAGTPGLDVQKGNINPGLRVGCQKSGDSSARGAIFMVGPDDGKGFGAGPSCQPVPFKVSHDRKGCLSILFCIFQLVQKR